jgi:hypothetical protein
MGRRGRDSKLQAVPKFVVALLCDANGNGPWHHEMLAATYVVALPPNVVRC